MKIDFSKIKTFNDVGLYEVEWQIELKLSALSEMVENDEKSIVELELKHQKFKSENKIADTEVQHQDALENYLIDRELTIKNLVQFRRYSSCSLIFSVLESILFDLSGSELIQSLKHTEKFKGKDDFTIYSILIKEKYGIIFSQAQSNFTRIKQQKKIRDLIVHKNGNITDKEFIEKNGIKVINNKVQLSKKYLDFLINEIKQFTNHILWEIDAQNQ